MVEAIPTGVVSFLFSDVEGSTGLWQTDTAGMAESLALHDQIFRTVADQFGGHVFSTAGDAFSIAFSTPGDALEAAVEIQRRLQSATWPGPPVRVRMGIHTGTANERDADYFGPSVNLAARIMSAGQGGRILLSGVMAELVADRVGPAIEVVDHGAHRLDGIDEPHAIHEVLHRDLARVDGPLRTAELVPHNLPVTLSSFVGRVEESRAVARLLEESRLVVLTGVGGTGKTRLAVECARGQLAAFDDGVWMVELAPVATDALVMAAIGDVFELRPGESASITDVVTRYLWPKSALVVLDNCEHVLRGAASAIRAILAAAPHVRILATSRESIGIDGEVLVRVPSLGLPDGGDPLAAESVQMFLDRADATAAELSAGTMQAIADICRRVDGIPLGVELAAARVRSMSPEELLDRLDSSFRILGGSSKSFAERQRTLNATIDWSHDLLTAHERSAFRRLSVFAGGLDMTSAEAVCALGEIDDTEVVDLVDSLVDKSLVSRNGTGRTTRLRMLEPVRQYAASRLDEAGESAETFSAHAAYFASFVAEASPRTRSSEQMDWERRLDADYDNIRLAFRSLLAAGAIDEYLDMAFDLMMYWVHVGMQIEGIETCLAGLQTAPATVDPARLCRTWFVAGGLGAEITKPEAVGHARRGLDLARKIGDPGLIGRLELQLGAAIRHSTTDQEYLEHLVEARDILDRHPDPMWWEPDWERAFLNLLFAAYLPGTDLRKREHSEAAITTFGRLGDRAMLAASLTETVGEWRPGEEARILGNMERALEIFDEVRVPYWQGHARMILGTLLMMQGEPDDAAAHLASGAEQLQDCGDLACWASSTRALARCEVELGLAANARSRMVRVIESFHLLPMREIVLPRTLDAAADALLAVGLHDEAAIVLGRAEATPFDVDSINPREPRLEAMTGELRESLGERFDVLRAEGAAMSADHCLGLARDWLIG